MQKSSDSPTPCDLARIHGYTALEAIRVSSQLFTMMADANPTKEQDAYGQQNQCVMDAAALELAANAMQHHVWPVTGRLTVPESSFTFIRQHENDWPENYPGAEGALTALALAIKELDRALDALDDAWDDLDDEGNALYRLLLGAFFVAHNVHGLLDSITTCFHDEAAVESVCQGRPIPKYDRAKRAAWILRENPEILAL
jgi:hypothetical protein